MNRPYWGNLSNARVPAGRAETPRNTAV